MKTDFINRLTQELEELTRKRELLAAFLDTNRFLALSKEHQCLLCTQQSIMISYECILQQRLNLLRGN